ncbi:MAG: DoxX family protein [Candidatus Hydrogenedentales bacterium]
MANLIMADGRVLLALVFLASGFMKIVQFNTTADQMYAEGMEYVTILLIGAIIFELVGGILVLIGWHPRIGALLLILFLIPTTLIFHDFWMTQQHTDAAAQQNQMAHFMKNVAIMGGLLAVMAFDLLRVRERRVAAH